MRVHETGVRKGHKEGFRCRLSDFTQGHILMHNNCVDSCFLMCLHVQESVHMVDAMQILEVWSGLLWQYLSDVIKMGCILFRKSGSIMLESSPC